MLRLATLVGLLSAFGCSREKLDDAKNAAAVPPQEKPKAQAEEQVEVEPSPPIESMSASVGHVCVGVDPPKVDYVSLTTLGFDREARSKDKLLQIQVVILNNSESKLLHFLGWGHDDGGRRAHASLADNFGNRYKLRHFGFGSEPVGQFKNGPPIHPKKSAVDLLVFDEPIASAEALYLDLEGIRVGQSGVISLVIPRSKVTGIQKNSAELAAFEKTERERALAEQAARDAQAEKYRQAAIELQAKADDEKRKAAENEAALRVVREKIEAEKAARLAAATKAEADRVAANRVRYDAAIEKVTSALKAGTAPWAYGSLTFHKRRIVANAIKVTPFEDFKDKIIVQWNDVEQKAGPYESEAAALKAKLPADWQAMTGLVKAEFRVNGDRPTFVRVWIGTSIAQAGDQPSPTHRLYGWHKLLTEKFK